MFALVGHTVGHTLLRVGRESLLARTSPRLELELRMVALDGNRPNTERLAPQLVAGVAGDGFNEEVDRLLDCLLV